METYLIITLIGVLIVITLSILILCDIKYKGKCILHNWEYRYESGDYWKYTGTFLKYNRRYVCKKCYKEVKEK